MMKSAEEIKNTYTSFYNVISGIFYNSILNPFVVLPFTTVGYLVDIITLKSMKDRHTYNDLILNSPFINEQRKNFHLSQYNSFCNDGEKGFYYKGISGVIYGIMENIIEYPLALISVVLSFVFASLYLIIATIQEQFENQSEHISRPR